MQHEAFFKEHKHTQYSANAFVLKLLAFIFSAINEQSRIKDHYYCHLFSICQLASNSAETGFYIPNNEHHFILDLLTSSLWFAQSKIILIRFMFYRLFNTIYLCLINTQIQLYSKRALYTLSTISLPMLLPSPVLWDWL